MDRAPRSRSAGSLYAEYGVVRSLHIRMCDFENTLDFRRRCEAVTNPLLTEPLPFIGDYMVVTYYAPHPSPPAAPHPRARVRIRRRATRWRAGRATPTSCPARSAARS